MLILKFKIVILINCKSSCGISCSCIPAEPGQ